MDGKKKSDYMYMHVEFVTGSKTEACLSNICGAVWFEKQMSRTF